MSDSKRRLPVDPLSERAWRRVQEAVFAELERPADSVSVHPTRPKRARFGLRYVMPAAALVLVAGAAWLLRPAPIDSSPRATSARIVATNDVTRTTVGDVTVEVIQGTELVVTGSEGEQQTVVLERGRAEFSVPKRNARPAFRVHAADVLVEVIGTRFWVSRHDAEVNVGVHHGTVRVSSGIEQRLLQAGEEWPAKPTGASNGPVPPETVASAPPVVVVAPPPARVPEASVAPADQGASEPKVAPSAATVPSGRERYEAASRLEATDASAAIRMYLELARQGGPWAANALYAAARLELERGRRDAARQLLAEYLSRFPKGTNAREAKMLLERAR